MSARVHRSGRDLDRDLRLMVITDRGLSGRRNWLEIIVAAAEAGATAVQLRDKRATSRELLGMAERLRAAVEPYGTLILIDDRFDIACAAGAHGVHLGDADLPVDAVRRVAPRGFVIGRSADTVSDAAAARRAGADYIGAGAVFPTRSKAEVAGEAIGTERLAALVAAVDLPIVAIGGITSANAAAVGATGASGIAVISAVMTAEDPGAATRELLQAFETGRLDAAGPSEG